MSSSPKTTTGTAQRYRVLSLLGKGGMGKVYKAKDTRLDEVVALKVLDPSRIGDKESVQRFLQEVKLARRVRHRNIVSTYEFGVSRNLPFVVMQYVEGQTLDRVIRDEGVLSHEQVVDLGAQICDGLQAAHEADVIHRDLKPGNVIVDGKGVAYILDFGIALARGGGASRITMPETLIGTPKYMSPEQIQGAEVDHRTDLYSLGVILYEMVAGNVPFTRTRNVTSVILRQLHETPPPPRQINPQVSEALEAVILKCMEKDPASRYASAAEVGYALRDTLNPVMGVPTMSPADEENETLVQRKLKILVTDDSEISRADFRMKLDGMGHELVEAADGPEALQIAANGGIDIVFLDVMMPGMDGWEVCQCLKTSSQTESIPVVILTSLDGAEPRGLGALLAADEFLTKPVDRTQLRETLKKFFEDA